MNLTDADIGTLRDMLSFLEGTCEPGEWMEEDKATYTAFASLVARLPHDGHCTCNDCMADFINRAGESA